MKRFEDKIAVYKKLNALSRKGSAVCFDARFFSSMNIEELALDYPVGVPVYNRSFEKLDITSAASVAESCLYELQPSKIFINIGENDVQSVHFDEKSFASKYEWLLLTIHRNCINSRLFIVSVVSDSPAAIQLNSRLEALAKEVGCTYVDINVPQNDGNIFLRAFNILKSYIRNFPPSFADAMGFQAV